MSAKKPRFKPRVGWAVDKSLLGGGWIAAKKRLTAATHRVRVTDARDLTPEKAVEKVLQQWAEGEKTAMVDLAASAGMSARIVNGKVRVSRAKQ